MRDGTRAAEISLSVVEVARDGVPGELGSALPVIGRLVEAGIAATAAEAIEAMRAMTLEYLKTRQRFDKPIGHNQVFQYRSIALEQRRNMAKLAAMMVDEPDPDERAHNIAMAKVRVGQASRFVAQNAVQLHCGIGMTEEYAVGHYFRWRMVIKTMFGDPAIVAARRPDALSRF
jgi:alkylation response protein AidB-like acyl-CoA dehydrogenase